MFRRNSYNLWFTKLKWPIWNERFEEAATIHDLPSRNDPTEINVSTKQLQVMIYRVKMTQKIEINVSAKQLRLMFLQSYSWFYRFKKYEVLEAELCQWTFQNYKNWKFLKMSSFVLNSSLTNGAAAEFSNRINDIYILAFWEILWRGKKNRSRLQD